MIVAYLVLAIITFILYVKWRQTYWHRKGVPTLDTEFFYGHFKSVVTNKLSSGEQNLHRYKALQKIGSTHAGIYFFWQPIYVPLDPQLIKLIIQKDFNYFMGHGIYHHPNDILTMNLFNLEGERWRNLRAKLTPTFTSGKMKMMFETVLEKAEALETAVGKCCDIQESVRVKDLLGRFTTDVIASCAFGIECNSLEEQDNIFREYGKKIVAPNTVAFWLTGLIPWRALGNLGFKNSGYDVTNFFTNIVKDTIETREANEIFRKDFMHLLIQLKNQGATSDSTKVTGGNNAKEKPSITENDIIAQCFVFFFAGFETSSTTMTFALLELAQNLHVQDKLREEIDRVLARHDGKVTYESIMGMNYLENVINETLRKYPPLTVLPRTCTRNYTVPGTSVVIEKGTRVQVPVWGLHMDPQYYPDPEVFDPERFSEENRAKRPEFTFMPFGEGPRMCIGLRFGMLQTKVGLVSLIKNFKISLNKKTQLPIEMQRGNLIITVKDDVWLDVVKI